jgi:hypothetical protein
MKKSHWSPDYDGPDPMWLAKAKREDEPPSAGARSIQGGGTLPAMSAENQGDRAPAGRAKGGAR